MSTQRTLGLSVATAALLMTMAGCSGLGSSSGDDAAGGSGNGTFCDVLLSDTRTSATVFSVVIPMADGPVNVDDRIALLDRIGEVPPGLEEDFTVWQDYLATVSENSDDPAAILATSTDETKAAGKALLAEHTGSCL